MKTKLSILLLGLCFNLMLNAQVTFNWAKSIGSSVHDHGVSVKTDAAGNVYWIGTFGDTVDIDPGPGVYTLFPSLTGISNGFLMKLDPLGNLLWVKQYEAAIEKLTIDASGNLCIAGVFGGNVDLDPGVGSSYFNAGTGADLFVSKLDSSGNLIWAKQITSTINGSSTKAIEVDLSGNVYTAGIISDTSDFDPGSGVYNFFATGSYVCKFDASGNFVWANSFANSTAYGLAVDVSSEVYVSGEYNGSVDLDPGPGTLAFTSTGLADFYVQKFNPMGGLIWAKATGGTGGDRLRDMLLDGNNIYLTGQFAGTCDFDPSPSVSNLTSLGSTDIFLCKLDTAGLFVWAKNTGGSGAFFEYGYDIDVDTYSNVYVCGRYVGTSDFDPGAGTYNLISAGSYDAFIWKLDSFGNFIWAQSVGGPDIDPPNSLDVDASGNIYLSGDFGLTADLDPGAGVFNFTSLGQADAYVLKLNDPSAVGIESITLSTSILTPFVFPNPSSGEVSVQFKLQEPGAVLLTICNVLGETVYSSETQFSDGLQSVELDVSGYSKGVYFVNIKTRNMNGSSRLIKQ